MHRFRALDLHDEGGTQSEIAEALGVTKMAVSKWLKAVRGQERRLEIYNAEVLLRGVHKGRAVRA